MNRQTKRKLMREYKKRVKSTTKGAFGKQNKNTKTNKGESNE